MKMKSMKTKTKVIACALVAVLAVGAVAALLTDTKVLTNEFNFSASTKVDITATEPNWVEPAKVLPGDQIPKDPTVELAAGSEASWVRAKIEIQDPLTTDMLQGLDAEKWTLKGGYYYLKDGLDAAGVKAVLFTRVDIPSRLDTTAVTEAKNIDVTFEAVQKKNCTQDLSKDNPWEGFDTDL